MKVESWPIWTKEVSEFDWFYENTEECLIIEGEVDVFVENKKYSIKPGDFVTFKKGLSCRWEIKSPIKKHYNFK